LPYVIEFINKFIKIGLQFGLNTTYLFPSFRKCDIGVDTPVKVGDFTTELVKPITERLTGKALTSRNTRTSVISDKVVDMTPKERMDFAQECGHTLDTQKDAYSVFNPAPKQTIIVNAKKKIEPELKVEVKAEVSPPPEYTYENGLLSCKNISMILLDKIIDKLDTVDSCTTNSVSKLWSFKIKLGLRDAHALIKLISSA
jgi:hypothetical protein